MGFDVETVKTDLKRLLKQGNQLYLSLAYSTESGAQKEETKKYLEKNGVDVKKFPDFQTEYEVWYSEALQYIKTFIPDRTNDFVALYNDYNEELKNAGVIDLPTWRHIQLLGDLRNLCCHDKKSEPTKDQAKDLLDGTTKICKTVY